MTTLQSETGFSPPGLPEVPQSEGSQPTTRDYRSRSDRGSPEKGKRETSGDNEELGVGAPRRVMAAGATASRPGMKGRKPWADEEIKEDEESFGSGLWPVPDDEVASRGRCSQTSRSSELRKMQANLFKLKAEAAKLKAEEAKLKRQALVF